MMKPMVYTRKIQYEILCHDTYKGYEFIIASYGTHPCAYIAIPKEDKRYGKDYDNDVWAKVNGCVHWGLTYAKKGLHGQMADKWVIGWDYNHALDYSGIYQDYPIYLIGGRRWTTEEILEEVKAAIDEIVKEEGERVSLAEGEES